MPKPPQLLNSKQTEILLMLYKFRFITKDMVIQYQELTATSYTQVRLTNLRKQEYIGRRYTGRDKILGKPARYYLESKGIRFLLAEPQLESYGLNPKVLNLLYKDKHATEHFIEESLAIATIYLALHKTYDDDLDFYTKSELAGSEQFLKSLPTAFLSFSGKHSKKSDVILELVDSMKPYFTHRRRVNQYLKQYEAGRWQEQTDSDYPIVIFMSDDANLMRKLQRSINFSLGSRGITGLRIQTCTLEELETVLHAL